MQARLTMVYWRGEHFFVGKLLDHPDIMTQGETLEELEENLKDAYLAMGRRHDTQSFPLPVVYLCLVVWEATKRARTLPRPGILKTLRDEAEKRAGRRMPRMENHALLCLSGLLAYLGAKPSSRCLRAIANKFRKPKYAASKLLDLRFVSALGLKGLQEAFRQHRILMPLARQRLIDLADEYGTITPAVAHLRSLL